MPFNQRKGKLTFNDIRLFARKQPPKKFFNRENQKTVLLEKDGPLLSVACYLFVVFCSPLAVDC